MFYLLKVNAIGSKWVSSPLSRPTMSPVSDNHSYLGLNCAAQHPSRLRGSERDTSRGSGHVLECMGLHSMDVMVATPWNCLTCISMALHRVTGLTFAKCSTGDSMECFHGKAGMAMMVEYNFKYLVSKSTSSMIL